MKEVRHLDVSSVLEEFQKVERSKAHRKATFKIEAAFQQAIDTILRAESTKKLARAK